MLFERASEVAGFDRYVLARVANKTDQRSMFFSYPQQRVAGAVRQQAPFIHSYHCILQPRRSDLSEQPDGASASSLLTREKAFNCSDASTGDLVPNSFHS